MKKRKNSNGMVEVIVKTRISVLSQKFSNKKKAQQKLFYRKILSMVFDLIKFIFKSMGKKILTIIAVCVLGLSIVYCLRFGLLLFSKVSSNYIPCDFVNSFYKS